MPLTRAFRETVQARAKADASFRAGLYEEAVRVLLEGDLPTARVLLREFVNATIGFDGLAEATGVHKKSLARMLGPNGNPHAEHLLAMMKALQSECGISVSISAKVVRPARRGELKAA